MKHTMLTLAVLGLASCHQPSKSMIKALTHQDQFFAGAAERDITGPALGLGTLGYAAPVPKTMGIQQRLKARAFVIKEDNSDKRVALVVVDECFVSWGIKSLVLEKLQTLADGQFEDGNVMITASHTHSAPGGISNNHYYNIPFNGISRQNIAIIVQGIADAITAANHDLKPVSIKFNSGELMGANINRSLFAYLNNPADERSRYRTDVDTESAQLSFKGIDGKPLGLFNWFAVHATSAEKDNGLITGDNKGYASYHAKQQIEKKFGSPFVAAFPSKSSGDASPNVGRDVDGDGDWDCPANANFACSKMIGGLQSDKALDLFEREGQELRGTIDYRVSFIDLENQRVSAAFTGSQSHTKTCGSGVGFSMIAGSEEDGPGVGKEGQTCSEAPPIRRLLCRINVCHGQKIVALNTASQDPKWIDSKLPIQLIRIGSLLIAAGPGEFTTMAGRRLEETVQNIARGAGITRTVFMGYSNDYAGYTTTREEYQMQHYEGGHTLFGEWQLAAYQENFARVTRDLVEGTVPSTVGPPVLRYDQFEEAEVVAGDDAIGTESFGTVMADVKDRYASGESASLTFVSANPNNDLFIGRSFFDVQKQDGGEWRTIATDDNWETAIGWFPRTRGQLLAKIEWAIPAETAPGTYRILFRGASRAGEVLTPFEGASKTFTVE